MTEHCLLLATSTADSTLLTQFFESPACRVSLSIAFTAFGLWWLLPGPKRRNRIVGTVLSVLGIAGLWTTVPLIATISIQSAFWLMAAVAIGASLATITSRKPIYSAIWFAVSLLGVAGLFLLQGAQFLAIATIAVYAGAIIVTFLFVLMLAQPTGQSFYDRISWGRVPRIIVPLFAMITVGLIAHSIGQANPRHIELHKVVRAYLNDVESDGNSPPTLEAIRVQKAGEDIAALTITVSNSSETTQRFLNDNKIDLQSKIAQIDAFKSNVIRYNFSSSLSDPQHVANLGGQLFSTQLIAIQVAGCLLLVALVGAIAIASGIEEIKRPANRGGSTA